MAAPKGGVFLICPGHSGLGASDKPCSFMPLHLCINCSLCQVVPFPSLTAWKIHNYLLKFCLGIWKAFLIFCLYSCYSKCGLQMTTLWSITGELVSEWVKVKVAQSCPTLCDPIDYTVHGILQARILERVAFPFSRGIFPTQGSNPDLLHYRRILYQLSLKGSPNW